MVEFLLFITAFCAFIQILILIIAICVFFDIITISTHNSVSNHRVGDIISRR